MTAPDEIPTPDETQNPDETPTEEIPVVENPPQSRRALGAALIGGTVLTIGAVLALGSGSGHRTGSTPTMPALPPTPTIVARPDPSSPFPTPPQTNTPATPVKPTVRWKGTVTVSGPDTHRDLDVIPPRTSPDDGDLNGSWLETDIKADSGNVQIAVLHGGNPGYTKCRDAVLANGSEQSQELHAGDVLCVHTSQGRIVRLVTVFAVQTSNDPIVEFHATIWDPPIQ